MSLEKDFDAEVKRYSNKAGRSGLWVLRNPIKSLLLLFVLIGFFSIISFGGFFVNNAVKVVKQEFKPEELLRKYEWFKDASAMLDKKLADIEVYSIKLAEFKGMSRKDMDRTDKEQKSQWQIEVAGITSSFNDLAAQYNSQMSKFNWRFCNAGTLPQGATVTLPRKYKTYQTGVN